MSKIEGAPVVAGLKLSGNLQEAYNNAAVPRPTNVTETQIKPIRKRTIYVYYLGNHVSTIRVNNKMLAYHIAQFYPDSDERRALAPELVAAIIGILLNILEPRATLDAGSFHANFLLAGYMLEARVITPPELHELCEMDERYEKFTNLFEQFETILPERDIFLVLSGVLLLTIGKQVNPEGFQNWYTKRVSAFAGCLGYFHAIDILTVPTRPLLTALVASYSFLSSARPLRAGIFRILISGSQQPDRVANVFKDVVLLLRGTEMAHILLIDRYLYRKYPELRAMRCLSNESIPMEKAWRYLASLNEDEIMYCKLLQSKEETMVLNRNNFQLFAIAAHTAASYENPSMKNYRTSSKGAGAKVMDTVNRYLLQRESGALLAMGDSPDSMLSGHERIEYFKQVLSDIERKIEGEDSIQRT